MKFAGYNEGIGLIAGNQEVICLLGHLDCKARGLENLRTGDC